MHEKTTTDYLRVIRFCLLAPEATHTPRTCKQVCANKAFKIRGIRIVKMQLSCWSWTSSFQLTTNPFLFFSPNMHFTTSSVVLIVYPVSPEAHWVYGPRYLHHTLVGSSRSCINNDYVPCVTNDDFRSTSSEVIEIINKESCDYIKRKRTDISLHTVKTCVGYLCSQLNIGLRWHQLVFEFWFTAACRSQIVQNHQHGAGKKRIFCTGTKFSTRNRHWGRCLISLCPF